MALLTIDRQATLYGKAFAEDGTTQPLRIRVIGRDRDGITAELSDGALQVRGARLGLDGLGFYEVVAIVHTRTTSGERTYLRLWPAPSSAA